MNSNLQVNVNQDELVNYGMSTMSMSSPVDPNQSFLQQMENVHMYQMQQQQQQHQQHLQQQHLHRHHQQQAMGSPVNPHLMPQYAAPPQHPMDLHSPSKNRNRGNYRCSRCGEPKKGHVCPLVPANFKCNRCGNSKKTCTCEALPTRDIGIQVEMDPDMTTRALDLSKQRQTTAPWPNKCHTLHPNLRSLKEPKDMMDRESSDTYPDGVGVNSGGYAFDYFRLDAGGKLVWEKPLEQLQDKTLYLNLLQTGLFHFKRGDGSLALWVPHIPSDVSGGHLELNVKINPTGWRDFFNSTHYDDFGIPLDDDPFSS